MAGAGLLAGVVVFLVGAVVALVVLVRLADNPESSFERSVFARLVPIFLLTVAGVAAPASALGAWVASRARDAPVGALAIGAAGPCSPGWSRRYW